MLVSPQEIFRRGLAKRCPACGRGKLFRNWFTMHSQCEACGYDFRREPGFYLGSIYVNYGLTSLCVAISYVYMFFQNIGEDWQRMAVLLPFALLFPIWFFPYARSLWLAFDFRWDGARGSGVPRNGNADGPKPQGR